MDEKALRAHFERAGSASVPPSTVDVALARKLGRRRLRLRRAGVPAVSLGIVVAVGALFATGVLPPSASGRPATHGHKLRLHKPGHARGPMAPASFDPLAIYGSFGWLPRGFSATNSDSPQETNAAFANVTGPHRESIALTVYAAHRCSTKSGPIWWPPKGSFRFVGTRRRYLHSRRYQLGLVCGQAQTFPTIPIVPAAQPVDGHRAYLMPGDLGQPNALAWEYAREGWAVVKWLGPKPAQIAKIADAVRFHANGRLLFPFRLTGVPSSWKVTGAGSQVEAGKLRGYLLYLEPPGDSHGITIVIEPPYTNGCDIGGTTQPATFDGVSGVTRTAGQEACFPDLHGMYVYVRSSQAGGGLGLLHHVQVLGPDPANWTTRPLGG